MENIDRRSGATSPHRVTINDVADAAGVSKSVVSYSLSGRGRVGVETRKKVLAAAEKLGWQPSLQARGLSQSRTFNAGIVFARDPVTLGADPFFAPFIAGMENELAKFRYALLLQVNTSGVDSELDDYRRLVAENRVDGVVLTDLKVDDRRMQLLDELGMPFVPLGLPTSGGSTGVVYNDEYHSVGVAMNHLVARGHRSITLVAGPDYFVHAVARTKAFLAYCAEFDIDGEVVEGDFGLEGAASVVSSVLPSGRIPTAVVFANSLMAISGLKELKAAGEAVPERISVVSLDDNPFASYVTPALTAIGGDAISLGRFCVQQLMKKIAGEDPEPIVVKNDLVERGSTSVAIR